VCVFDARHAISLIVLGRCCLFPPFGKDVTIRRLGLTITCVFLSKSFFSFSYMIQMQVESSDSSSVVVSTVTVPSDQVIPQTIQEGFERMVVQAGAGFVIGGMAGIVLARGGAAGARRVMAGFGAGVGLGSAWTRTSMDIEDILSSLPK
jgi:hypothetical protein